MKTVIHAINPNSSVCQELLNRAKELGGTALTLPKDAPEVDKDIKNLVKEISDGLRGQEGGKQDKGPEPKEPTQPK